jgi:hypothetical protein
MKLEDDVAVLELKPDVKLLYLSVEDTESCAYAGWRIGVAGGSFVSREAGA